MQRKSYPSLRPLDPRQGYRRVRKSSKPPPVHLLLRMRGGKASLAQMFSRGFWGPAFTDRNQVVCGAADACGFGLDGCLWRPLAICLELPNQPCRLNAENTQPTPQGAGIGVARNLSLTRSRSWPSGLEPGLVLIDHFPLALLTGFSPYSCQMSLHQFALQKSSRRVTAIRLSSADLIPARPSSTHH